MSKSLIVYIVRLYFMLYIVILYIIYCVSCVFWEFGEFSAKFWNFRVNIHREIIGQIWLLLTPFFNFPILHWTKVFFIWQIWQRWQRWQRWQSWQRWKKIDFLDDEEETSIITSLKESFLHLWQLQSQTFLIITEKIPQLQ